jgi:uncharacterized protein
MAKIVIGRAIEKAKIDKMMASNQAEFLAIYGRRRVGKTFLIRQYLEKEMVFDLSGEKDATLAVQMTNFFAEYLKRTNGLIETTPPKNWKQAFQYLNTYLIAIAKTKKNIAVFLDEMPWMDTPKSRFISSLEHFWNQDASKIDNLLLIACGSATSWILENLIKARGGLYNRITNRIKLQPFTLSETEQFFKASGIHLTKQLIVELYMAMGGIPHYLKEVTANKSAAQIIDALCFKKSGLLFDEYDQLYYSLFKNAEIHIAIVNILSKKHYGLSQQAIVNETKLPQGSISKALVELTDCDFISAGIPFDKKKKDTIYRLTDQYSLFYNRFIKNAKANTKWMNIYNNTTYKSWCGYAFENICIVHLPQILRKLGIQGMVTNVNSWFFTGNANYTGVQIDLLIDRADNCINICEIKFRSTNYLINKKDAELLKQRKNTFKEITKTKKNIFTTLITFDEPIKNEYYLQEINSGITYHNLFS